jgi:hypothetical protein
MIISLSNAYDTNLFTIKGINDTLTTIFNQKSNQIIKKKTDMSMGDAVKGKEIFVNRIKFYCDISDDEFLPIHTQDEWEAIVQAGKFKEEILEICPHPHPDPGADIRTDQKKEKQAESDPERTIPDE